MTLDYATLDQAALRTLLHERLCEVVSVDEGPDGAVMLRTHFRFPDGDSYPFYLLEAPAGGIRLSDEGDTLMRISYGHDIDAFLEGASRALMDRVLGESGVAYDDDGTFYLDTAPERLPDAMFTFGQALTRLYQIAQWPDDADRELARRISGASVNISLFRYIRERMETVIPREVVLLPRDRQPLHRAPRRAQRRNPRGRR